MEIINPKYKWFKKWARPNRERLAGVCPTHGFYRGESCSECANTVKRDVNFPNIEVFKPMVYEDICETPILIESKRQLKEECRKHDVVAARLL